MCAAPPECRDSELEKSIKAAMLRMKRVSADSEEDEDGDRDGGGESAEWDT